MDDHSAPPAFDQWCIIELFGRQVLAGRVTEQTIGGCSFIRLDVPHISGQLPFTRFYGNGAIYALTPCSEDVARLALERFKPKPVNVYLPELHLLTAPDLPSTDEDLDPE